MLDRIATRRGGGGKGTTSGSRGGASPLRSWDCKSCLHSYRRVLDCVRSSRAVRSSDSQLFGNRASNTEVDFEMTVVGRCAWLSAPSLICNTSHKLLFWGTCFVGEGIHSCKVVEMGSCHKRQKPQASIRNRQTRKVANAKGLNRNTKLTYLNLT